jgi:hypothetical protein
MNEDLPPLLPTSAYQAKQWIADLNARLAAHGIVMQEPPDEPTSCCGRGCNGCVWESYMSAVAYWCERARAALRK